MWTEPIKPYFFTKDILTILTAKKQPVFSGNFYSIIRKCTLYVPFQKLFKGNFNMLPGHSLTLKRVFPSLKTRGSDKIKGFDLVFACEHRYGYF